MIISKSLVVVGSMVKVLPAREGQELTSSSCFFSEELFILQGPFVHIASIVANLLGKLSSFKGLYEVSRDFYIINLSLVDFVKRTCVLHLGRLRAFVSFLRSRLNFEGRWGSNCLGQPVGLSVCLRKF